ncbi:MAG: MFS transporter [Arthrobacter sp.]|uniref:MFS transporter n=1 Tax=unclassified Arthrobacter TaxID=235627 RepID=UPI003FB6E2D0
MRTTHEASAPIVRRTITGMIVAMALIEALSGVTQGYLNPILPALGPRLDIDDPTINGIFLISNVSFAVMTPIISRLGDSFGYRLVLRCSTVVVAAGVLLMALAPTLLTVSIGVVMLTCVVGFIPLMMGILRVTSSADTRRGVSVMIGTLMIMVGFGGLLAGLIGAHDPARGFWVGVPFALLALLMTFFLPDAGAPTREPIALLPMTCCSLGLVGLVIALSMGPDWGWLSAKTLLAGIIGVGLLLWWTRIDARAEKQFINLRLLAVPRVRSVSLATFFFGFASVSYFGTNGIFLHADAEAAGYGFGLDPLAIALVLALASVLALGASLLTGRALTAIGERTTLMLAGATLASGFVVMALGHGSFTGYCAGFALFNMGMGIYQSATRALSVEGVPLEETATAAGLNELALSVGIAVGAAVVKMLSSTFAADGHILMKGMIAIWITLILAALVATLFSRGYTPVTASAPTEEVTA